MYGTGISKVGSVLDAAVEAGIVEKSGSWFSYGDAKLGQGRENSKAYLQENADLLNEIDEKVRIHYNLGDKHINENEAGEPSEEE